MAGIGSDGMVICNEADDCKLCDGLEAEIECLRAEVERLKARAGIKSLTTQLGECDSDCATQRGGTCTCGAREFKAKFGG